MRILLCLLLVGCSSKVEPVEVVTPEEPAREPSLDEVGDSAEDMPFGQALPHLTADQAQAVFPLLLAAAAPADQLAAGLPEQLAGWERGPISQGIQEDELAPWAGAFATYSSADQQAVVLIQDTGWQPTALNRFVRAWGEPEHRLGDGRPVASLADAQHGGTALHTPVELARPRILIKAWSDTADADTLVPLLEAVPIAPLLPLLERRAQGSYAPSPLFSSIPTDSLRPAEALRAALPGSDLPTLGEGWGLRRERMRIVVTSASRLLDTGAGVIELRLTDLGPADQPVELMASSDESSADRLREDGAEDKLKCKESMGLCKRMTLAADRYVLAVVGPPEAKAEIERLIAAFDPASL